MAPFVRLTSARLWAGLLVVLALAICTTGIAQPAMAAPMDMMATDTAPTGAVAMARSAMGSDGPYAGESVGPVCSMGDMECAPQAQHRPLSVPFPPADGILARAVDRAVMSVDVERAPPSPASRGGPDLDRLCVSRT
ncbi:hypothetical protein [Streptomyces sp. NPDC005181]|uniref:hypothetical protein n=1 Tax=Streptomyces sp. NPDC005181 TaxID=3156869 RepID=UPI0033A9E08D